MSENLLCFYKFSLHLYILYDILCINSLHCIQTTVQTEQAGGYPVSRVVVTTVDMIRGTVVAITGNVDFFMSSHFHTQVP